MNDREGSSDMAESMKERTSLASVGGKDVFEKAFKFMAADNARKMGIYPFFRPLDFADGPEAQINGKRVVMFGSNNYLGLTTHPKVRDAAKAAIDKYGTSMTGSRLVNGSMRLHEEFEEKLAKWFNKESALVFTTGYQVNIATLRCAALQQAIGRLHRPQRARFLVRRRAARPIRRRAARALPAQRRRIAGQSPRKAGSRAKARS